MHPPLASVLWLALLSAASARLHNSLVPEDPYAFPKYRVLFLNGQPVLNETAQRWLQDGLRGGEDEFLDQSWGDAHWNARQYKEIEGAPDAETQPAPADTTVSNYTLEHLKLGSLADYLCLIPPPPEENTSLPEDAHTDVTPVHSWSLLQPLAGTCLYHRQGWFTYSYCHNSHVRQFHELSQAHRPGGEYHPEEDTEWEAYTLGRAPPSLEGGADLTVAEQASIAANVELARGAGSRYLVQRWGDGTHCDKTGRRREIEIQFHCSMTMPDTILFVKETQTCHYVLHIATPRLCGEPGFKSRHDSREEGYIRCREVLSADEYTAADKSLPPADHPAKRPRRHKELPAPPPPAPDAAPKLDARPNSMLRRALEHLLKSGDVGQQVIVEPVGDGETEFVIEFLDPEDILGEGEGDEGEGGETTLADILRAAGYDITGQKGSAQKKAADDEEGEDKAKGSPRRDEL